MEEIMSEIEKMYKLISPLSRYLWIPSPIILFPASWRFVFIKILQIFARPGPEKVWAITPQNKGNFVGKSLKIDVYRAQP